MIKGYAHPKTSERPQDFKSGVARIPEDEIRMRLFLYSKKPCSTIVASLDSNEKYDLAESNVPLRSPGTAFLIFPKEGDASPRNRRIVYVLLHGLQ